METAILTLRRAQSSGLQKRGGRHPSPLAVGCTDSPQNSECWKPTCYITEAMIRKRGASSAPNYSLDMIQCPKAMRWEIGKEQGWGVGGDFRNPILQYQARQSPLMKADSPFAGFSIRGGSFCFFLSVQGPCPASVCVGYLICFSLAYFDFCLGNELHGLCFVFLYLFLFF